MFRRAADLHDLRAMSETPAAGPDLDATVPERSKRWRLTGGMQPWLLSLLIHAAAFTVLGTTVPRVPEGTATTEVRVSGIALVARQGADEGDSSDERRAGESPTIVATVAYTAPLEPTTSPVESPSLAESPPLLETPPSLEAPPTTFPGPRLPILSGAEFAAAAFATALPSASDAPQVNHGTGASPGQNESLTVETQVFGVKGRGSKFVYVFDRSSSMEGPPLMAAKRELIASLHSLKRVHQFQIVFYNQQPQMMLVRGHSRQLAFGDDRSKELAARFVGGISAYGATDHMQALRQALALKPDVIFFLTDADEPQLTRADFDQLRTLNHGTSINTIEFGLGEPKPQFNFLKHLAAEHGGQHTYVDVTRLPR
jgi:hypothetical protein